MNLDKLSLAAKAMLFDVSVATSDAVLFMYLADANTDPHFSQEERDQIHSAVTQRSLELSAGYSHKPRWSTPSVPSTWIVNGLAADALNPS